MRTVLSLVAACFAAIFPSAELCRSEEPVAVRVEAFTVAPAQTPMIYVVLKNCGTEPLDGSVSVELPGAWRALPEAVEVHMTPGQATRLSFRSEQGANTESNRYPVEVVVTAGGQTTKHRQNVFCASAPYFKPEIDGRIDDWQHAIPVTFEAGGKKTAVSTYWNRRAFSLLVAVEQTSLRPLDASRPFDAVQFALAPEGATTGTSPDEEAKRFEFLLAATGGAGQGRVFQLTKPGVKLAQGAQPQSLDGLEVEGAEAAVRREAGTTYYECTLPFGPMRSAIRPSEGRAFLFSVVVHDPSGTGLRDLGQATGLWPSQRNPLAWSRFQGDSFGEAPPYDSKTPWGFCSSKY